MWNFGVQTIAIETTNKKKRNAFEKAFLSFLSSFLSFLSSFLFHFLAKQRCRSRPGDSHTHKFADVVVALIEDNHLALLRPSAQLLARPLAEILHQDGELLAFIALVGLGTEVRLKVDKLGEAADFHLLADVVG